MGQQQTIVAILERGRAMLGKHLADFSDGDMLARTSPTANHAAYQLAHLLRTTAPMMAAIAPGAKVAMPPKTEGDAKAPPTSNDATAFATKAELLGAYDALIAEISAAVQKTPEADFDKPSPEQFKNFAPTLGQLAMMVPFHTSMHIGQIQTIRRMLGKPVLF